MSCPYYTITSVCIGTSSANVVSKLGGSNASKDEFGRYSGSNGPQQAAQKAASKIFSLHPDLKSKPSKPNITFKIRLLDRSRSGTSPVFTFQATHVNLPESEHKEIMHSDGTTHTIATKTVVKKLE